MEQLSRIRFWTWKHLIHEYKRKAHEIAELQRTAKSLNVRLPITLETHELDKMSLDRAVVVSKLYMDLRRVYSHLDALNAEIGRRTRLVGVL